MKKVLAFDVDQTLNVAKMPIPDEIAELLVKCLDHYEICPISGQKYEQFLIQIVNRLEDAGVTPEQLSHLHLFVAQGTQYYRYNVSKKDWDRVYNYPLTDEQVAKITETIEKAAKELGYWEEDKLADGDEIIENRLSQVTFSALGQKAGTEAKYAWDPDHKKREAIVKRCKELAPEFEYEIGGTTSINAITPGMNKVFGMTRYDSTWRQRLSGCPNGHRHHHGSLPRRHRLCPSRHSRRYRVISLFKNVLTPCEYILFMLKLQYD